MEHIRKLTVKYNGLVVGYLAELDGGEIGFQYDGEWISGGFSLSPFSLPLSDMVYVNNKNTFGGLYGVFNDSLPDGWGELLVSRVLAKTGINYERLSPLTKLSLIAGNGLGGLTYEPTQGDTAFSADYDLDELSRLVQAVLSDGGIDVELDNIYRTGGSSGGARPKAHIKGGGDEWIVKFPNATDSRNVGVEEYNANAAAQKCGINVNEFRLFPSELCNGYFGAKRFDRAGGRRVHMISLSALLETTHRLPNLDYFHLFQVISKICYDQSDIREAYRRMCFNVLYGNRDDHGKNFSFVYEDGRGYRLSPAYDITKTPNKPEHEMTVLSEPKPADKDLIGMAEELSHFSKGLLDVFYDVKERLS